MRPPVYLLAALFPIAVHAAAPTGTTTAVQSCTLVAESGELGDLQNLPAACHEPLPPCSTFKLANTLVGLETGVIDGTDHIREWDGVERRVRSWNQSHDLRSAFANSVLWYYQEIAEEVGAERMQTWLDAFDYGDADLSGGLTTFWLGSSLTISAAEQLAFLDRFHRGELAVSDRSETILRDISRTSFGRGYVEHAKTGWCWLDGEDETGPMANWYVGWIERDDGTWVFASVVHGPELERYDARDLAHQALRREGLLPPQTSR